MDNTFIPVINALKAKVEAKEQEIAPLRKQLDEKDAEINPLREMVNGLCKEAGIPPAYVIAGPATTSPVEETPKLKFRDDHFFNKELSEAAVLFLNAKKAADPSGAPTPANTDEIYSALTKHGYTFTGTNVANNKVALKTALTRNTAQIAKINDDLYGLRSWYGMRAKYKKSTDGGDEKSTDGGDDNSEAKTASAEPK